MDDRAQDSQTLRIAIALAVVIALGATAWWYWHRPAATGKPAPDTPALAAAQATPAEDAAAIRHPLPVAAPDEAPPPAAADVADPDAVAVEGLHALFGAPELAAWLIPDMLVRRLVATTDNLSRSTRTEPLRPLRAPPGPVLVQRETLDATVGTERIVLDERNAARYDLPVSLLAKTDMRQAATLYRRLYPLLQRSYEDLGYPDGYFNDRVVDTIDHLLATPEPAGPLLLEQPKVLYRFADPDLEARSAGQKLLLRMGVAHARNVKQKLREFREQISSKE